jgi:serine protease
MLPINPQPQWARFFASPLLLATFGLFSATAGAQTTGSQGKIAPMQPFQVCSAGEVPKTTNVHPRATGYADPFVQTTGDIDPSQDVVVIDFNDDLTHNEIQRFGLQYNLALALNSVWSDDPNVYIAPVEEGAVPWIKECLLAQAPTGWVEGVEENINYQILGGPSAEDETADASVNDPLYPYQWNFRQIHAEDAWKTSAGKNVVVAVIDTGVALEDDATRGIKRVKDLNGTASVKGYDFVDDDSFAWDGHGHGTHVAGTIAQTTNNRYGVAGLAHESKIMPLRVLNSRGFGQVSDIADAIRFAADNGASVINMSLGGPLPSLVMRKAIRHAHAKGVTIVAAAGNGGRKSPSFPAAYKYVVAVAATQFDKTTTFYSQWGNFVDVAAPGGNTRVDQDGDGRPDGVMQQTLKDGRTDEHDFLLYMGTSMASPHVAAVAALIIAKGVTHPDKVEAILKRSSDSSQKERFEDPDEFHQRYGSGIIQANTAVNKTVLEDGSLRLGLWFFLTFLGFRSLRRRDLLARSPGLSPGFVVAGILASSGFFLLHLLPMGTAWGVELLAFPIPEWDTLFLGPTYDQSPLLASALLPLLGVGLLAGNKRLAPVASGLAFGIAAFCCSEALCLTSDVQWIPGSGMLDRLWLLANAAFSWILGYLSWKRS